MRHSERPKSKIPEEIKMSVEENVQLVKDGYAAFGRGDIQ